MCVPPGHWQPKPRFRPQAREKALGTRLWQDKTPRYHSRSSTYANAKKQKHFHSYSESQSRGLVVQRPWKRRSTTPCPMLPASVTASQAEGRTRTENPQLIQVPAVQNSWSIYYKNPLSVCFSEGRTYSSPNLLPLLIRVLSTFYARETCFFFFWHAHLFHSPRARHTYTRLLCFTPQARFPPLSQVRSLNSSW